MSTPKDLGSYEWENVFPWFWLFDDRIVARSEVCSRLHAQFEAASSGPLGHDDIFERAMPEVVPGGVLIPHGVVMVRYRVGPTDDRGRSIRMESPLNDEFSVEDFVWSVHNATRGTWESAARLIVLRWLGLLETVDCSTGLAVMDLACDFVDTLDDRQEWLRDQGG